MKKVESIVFGVYASSDRSQLCILNLENKEVFL
jgi:hypothetical protein